MSPSTGFLITWPTAGLLENLHGCVGVSKHLHTPRTWFLFKHGRYWLLFHWPLDGPEMFTSGCGNVLTPLPPLFLMVINGCLPIADIDSAGEHFFMLFLFLSSVWLKSWNNKAAVAPQLDQTVGFLFPFECFLAWHPHLQFLLVPVFALTLQKEGHEGGSHLKVQPNVNNRGRDVPEEKPLFPHSLSNIFHLLLFFSFLFFFFFPVTAKCCCLRSSD